MTGLSIEPRSSQQELRTRQKIPFESAPLAPQGARGNGNLNLKINIVPQYPSPYTKRETNYSRKTWYLTFSLKHLLLVQFYTLMRTTCKLRKYKLPPEKFRLEANLVQLFGKRILLHNYLLPNISWNFAKLCLWKEVCKIKQFVYYLR